MDDDRKRGTFDRAVRAFNAHRFYEAHEDWETLWNEAEGDARRWLQGLIQIAAAFFHYERGFHDTGFVKLIREGTAKAAGFTGNRWGMRLDDFLAALEPWLAHADRVAGGQDLRGGAPNALPEIGYEKGVTPAPLPEETRED